MSELSVRLGGATLVLPRSRKARALLAYLAVTGREHRREHLCNLFWDVADDRRAALRWTLSKLRKVLEPSARPWLLATRTHVQLDLTSVTLDANELRHAARKGFELQSTQALETLAETCQGELLEGMLLPDFDAFEAWLEAVRAEARALHSKLRRVLVERLANDPERALPHARAWLDRSGDQEAQGWTERLSVALGGGSSSSRGGASGRKSSSDKPSLGAAPALNAPSRPVVGRDGEISRLCLIASEVRSQRTGRIVLLIGEPGMGKTRLLEELRYRQRDPAPCVLEATFFEAERHRPLAPFLDATRGALTDWQPPGVDASAPDREQLFETLAELIRRGAADQGLGLLLLDDAHLCDPSSSELLHYIVRTTARSPLLTVVACRPAELEDNAELSRALMALRRRHLVDEIHLRPLAKDALRTLVTAEAPSASIERLVNESAGNPLLALEMASALPEGDEVPRTLTDLVLARMASLSQDTRALVGWAAIFERGSVTALEAMCAHEVGDFLNALETASRYRFLRFETGMVGHGLFVMAHSLIHRVVYDAISPVRRAAMHRSVAEVLSKEHHGADRTSIIAYHATRADRADLAVRALIDGADSCAAMGAAREAGDLVDRALELLPRLEPAAALALELDALLVLGQVRKPDEPPRFVDRLTELGLTALDQGRPDHARRAFHVAANLRWEAGASHEGYGLARQAWQATRAAGVTQNVRSSSFMALCLAMMEKQLPDAQAIIHEAEALAQAEKGGTESAELALARSLLHLHGGRLDDARRDAADARLLCRLNHNMVHEALALQTIVRVEHAAKRPRECAAAAEALMQISTRIREGGEGALAHAAIALSQNSLDETRAELAEALKQLHGLDDKRRLAWVANRWARREREGGDCDAARRLATDALGAARAVEALSEAAMAACELMAAATLASDDQGYAEAEEVLAELEAEGALSHEARQLIQHITAAPVPSEVNVAKGVT